MPEPAPDRITEAIHSALTELHPDAAGRNCTGDWAGLKDDAAHIATRVRATLAEDNQDLRDRVAQTIADVHANTPAPPPGSVAVFVVDAYADAVMETIGAEAHRVALTTDQAAPEQEVARLRAINAELKNDAQFARDNQHFRMAAIIAAVICDTEHGNGEVDGSMPHFDLAGRILDEVGIDGHLQDREHQMSDLVEQIGALKHDRETALARAHQLAEEGPDQPAATLVCSHCDRPPSESHTVVPGKGEMCPGRETAQEQQ